MTSKWETGSNEEISPGGTLCSVVNKIHTAAARTVVCSPFFSGTPALYLYAREMYFL